MNKKIETLKVFFTISVGTFDLMATIQKAFGKNCLPTAMEMLHRIALIEINKENPNLELIDSYLQEMELLAEENAKNNKQ